MNSQSKWAEMQEEQQLINKLKQSNMDVEKQTKRQWISIVILGIVEILTRLNII